MDHSVKQQITHPLVLRKGCNNWPAFKKWDVDYLKKEFGEIQVCVNNYDDSHSTPYILQNYLHSHYKKFKDVCDLQGKLSVHESSQFLLENSKALNDLNHFQPFLNHSLTKDIFYSFWFGQNQSVTDLHTDNVDLYLFQIRGRKEVRLLHKDHHFSKEELIFKDELKEFFSKNKIPKNELFAAMIQLNTSKYSKIKAFRSLQVGYKKVVLEEGDVLIIPKDWWHATKCLNTSIAVNLEVTPVEEGIKINQNWERLNNEI